MAQLTQHEKLTAYLKSLDHHRPHLIMVKMGADGQPEWWSPQGVVMGSTLPPSDFVAHADAGLDILAALVTPEFGKEL